MLFITILDIMMPIQNGHHPLKQSVLAGESLVQVWEIYNSRCLASLDERKAGLRPYLKPLRQTIGLYSGAWPYAIVQASTGWGSLLEYS